MELRESEWLGDWFVLDEYQSAQPEGTAEEWREVIEAIKNRRNVSFRRVSVRFDSGFFSFTSPRNSIVDCEAILTPSEITDFVAQAESVLDEAQGMLCDGGGI